MLCPLAILCVLQGQRLFAGGAALVASAQQPPAQSPTQKTPPAPEFKDIDSFFKSLPSATTPSLDAARALWFTSVPLTCIDQLQPQPTNRPYFWEATFTTVDGYDKNRAFYGCSDWHSAVNATWTVVKLLKLFPTLPVGGLIREKLNDHLGKQNLDGELAFFKEAGQFERPYGYAWFLQLHSELMTWKDADAEKWAANADPLAKQFAGATIEYLKDLERPNRTATQANTALSLNLMLQYTTVAHESALERAIDEAARKFYANDKDCATDTEANAPELVSPCLTEAELMSRVLDQPSFVAWLDKFLPAPYSSKFKPLTTISMTPPTGGRGGRGRRGGAEAPAPAGAAAGEARGGEPPAATAAARGAEPPPSAGAEDRGAGGGRGRGRGGATNPRATMMGLAFSRAESLNRIADALPAADKRVAVFRRLAQIHGEKGMEAMSDPAALEAPWIGTYAISYIVDAKK